LAVITDSNALKFYREINKKINIHSVIVLGVSSHEWDSRLRGKNNMLKKDSLPYTWQGRQELAAPLKNKTRDLQVELAKQSLVLSNKALKESETSSD